MGGVGGKPPDLYHTDEAIAIFNSGYGWVKLTDVPESGTRIQAFIFGLTPGEHGLHIHSKGNPLDQCKAACSHFNPEGCVHGGPSTTVKHVGDLGNITADSCGSAQLDEIFPYVQLNGPKSVIGRSIIVHSGRDDLGKGGAPGSEKRLESLKTGNAGARLACAVIGIAKEKIIN